MDNKPYNIKDTKLSVFARILAQIDDITTKGQSPKVIYMSRELSDEFKMSCRDYGYYIDVTVDRDDDWDMAKFRGIPVRRVLDCTPSYLHVVGRKSIINKRTNHG
jgi:hypothetical protein